MNIVLYGLAQLASVAIGFGFGMAVVYTVGPEAGILTSFFTSCLTSSVVTGLYFRWS